MARNYKRDNRGRFARTGSAAKKRYKKGQSGKGAIHRRRAAQWNSGRKRDKAKVLVKTGVLPYGAATHGVSYVRSRSAPRKSKAKAARNGVQGF